MGTGFVDVGPVEALPAVGVMAAAVNGVEILVCRVDDGALYAIENLCTHEFCPLGTGRLVGGEIECPKHGARFDLRTGEATRLPAAAPIRTFPVKIEDGRVLVDAG
jgi:3-phenylpropionate/trans-cinnamate dioxygenase ferredoxin subunit